jgi:ribosomal-protein-alanine N-acetyltransferase
MDAAALQQMIRNFPDLRTPRLLLRRLRVEDAADIFTYASDPQMTPFVFWEPHRTIEDTREFLGRTLQGYAEGLPAVWGIQHLADGVIIGGCAYHDISIMNLRGEIGYALARKYWGQGLMTEVVRAVLDYGFNALGLNRIEARCDVDNTGSWRVMEKVGMKFEGVLRQNIVLHGRPRDAKMYGILREDWAATSKKSEARSQK